VTKNKLARFSTLNSYSHVVQVPFSEVLGQEHPLKGNWNKTFFKREAPLVLELGCGKGEYTTGLARKFPDKNFIGIDIKGARMYVGAKDVHENQIPNAGFLRTRVELISAFFAKGEVDEIWITFPDPQLKERRAKKRLTSSRFLMEYRGFLKSGGIVHLKTDCRELHEYTRNLLRYNQIPIHVETNDLYNSGWNSDILSIKTFYEQQFLDQGYAITYLQFGIDGQNKISEVPGEQ
jgi:tRNA (guanine-N7-)-methyltransferase